MACIYRPDLSRGFYKDEPVENGVQRIVNPSNALNTPNAAECTIPPTAPTSSEIVTEAPLQRDEFVMTRSQPCGYSRLMVKGLQHANAFVIQFRPANGADSKRFSGGIEHVASGRTALFRAVEELLQILLKMLETAASDKKSGTDELA